MNYIEASRATFADLQPKARLYLYRDNSLYVARIGNVDDWAAYKGDINQGLEVVANYGVKVAEDEAVRLFSICKEAKLNYRR
ncbi:hypothetical protein [Dendronalium sp. ChiSLP03b]|uniref:hypothetical protein n=1 Tax=Dendronalium sp. ChiSLP03b TaxID=3075381 RepID=UPI00391885D6